MIELKNINKIYKGSKYSVQALKDINVKFGNVGLVSIVGTSGCGKTTLLNLIGGLDSDYQGDIIFDNINVKQYNSKKLDTYRSEKIGFVFQEYNLINTIDVYSNIEIALSMTKINKFEKKKRILDISKRLGIEDLLKKSPLELSGGQKQRVAIARALIKKPQVILADEPTGALDSKTSKEIMKILKDISKECLIIMVTHNEKLANEYSNRIINMLDGCIIGDIKINDICNLDIKTDKKEKKIPLFQLINMSFNNLRRKLVRTLLMIFACSIGIVALCLVITVVNGMNLYIEDVQEQALRTYPITINSVVDDEEPEKENIEYEEYPDNDIIHIVDSDPSYYGHVNTFTNEFMDHIRKMDTNLYSAISYSGWVKMRLLSEYGKNYFMISSYTFLKELPYDYQYLQYEYDLLEGKLPEKKEDLVLVIDKNNCINRSVLTSLGIYNEDLTQMKFSDLIGKTYKVITPDLYYRKDGNKYVTYSSKGLYASDLYNEASVELTIKGIIRQKASAKTKLYGTSILYSPLLTDYILEYNNNCDIIKDQRKDPTVNVLTGEKFELIDNGNSISTVEYQYENNLSNFGGNYTVTRVLIYTDRFENFELIHDHIEKYNNEEATVSQIRYTDYLKNMTEEFSAFMDVLTKVLLIFAFISLTVAGIMIVIITYVSVIENTKQIGILRSLGMSKFNVTCLFIYENAILGLSSGIIGVTLGTLLIEPVLSVIINVIKDINLNSFNVDNLNMSSFNIIYLILLILGSMLLTVISGIIPSIMASKKDPVKALLHQ